MKLCAAWMLLACLFLPSVGRASIVQLSEQELLKFFSAETTLSAPLVTVTEGPAPSQESEAGSVKAVHGMMLVIPKGSGGAYRLRQGLPPVPVYQGDVLVTGKDSRASLLLQDGSLLILAAQSKMVLDQVPPSYSADRRDTRLQLLLGKLRAVVSKVTGNSSFHIQTPTAAAGIRGTDFALAVGFSPRSATSLMTVLVTGGGGSTVKLTGTSGEAVSVGPLSAASAEAGSPAAPPRRLGNAARDVLRRIAPELDRAAAEDAATDLQKEFTLYEKHCGLDRAVNNALARNAAPAEVLAAVIAQGSPRKIRSCLKALHCAGADKGAVRHAVSLFGISRKEADKAGRTGCGFFWFW